MSATTPQEPITLGYREFPTSKKVNDMLAQKAWAWDAARTDEAVVSLTGRVAALEAAGPGGAPTDLSGVLSRLTTAENRIDGVVSSITSLSGTVNSLATSVGGFSTSIANVAGAVNAEAAAREQAIAMEASMREQGDAAEIRERAALAQASVTRTAINPASFPEPWQFSPSLPLGGRWGQSSHYFAGAAMDQTPYWIETVYNNDQPIATDFAGAALGSIPVGMFVQHRQVGSNQSGNSSTHSIMALGVNASSGANDCVAVSGRVRKLDIPGGVGDSCGVWGSAYADSTQRGAVMALEGAIYQNSPGSTARDRTLEKWSVALHLVSVSLGSPATAAIAIDSTGQIPGHYGFWNAIIIDKNTFAGGALPGTVGINCASWDNYNQPVYGIKFGRAPWHIYAPQQLTLRGDDSVYIDQRPSGTSFVLDMGSTATSNFIIRRDGVDVFRFLAADGSLHLRGPIYYDL